MREWSIIWLDKCKALSQSSHKCTSERGLQLSTIVEAHINLPIRVSLGEREHFSSLKYLILYFSPSAIDEFTRILVSDVSLGIRCIIVFRTNIWGACFVWLHQRWNPVYQMKTRSWATNLMILPHYTLSTLGEYSLLLWKVKFPEILSWTVKEAIHHQELAVPYLFPCPQLKHYLLSVWRCPHLLRVQGVLKNLSSFQACIAGLRTLEIPHFLRSHSAKTRGQVLGLLLEQAYFRQPQCRLK